MIWHTIIVSICAIRSPVDFAVSCTTPQLYTLLDANANILANVFSEARGQLSWIDGKMPQVKVLANDACNDAVAEWAFVLPNWKPTLSMTMSLKNPTPTFQFLSWLVNVCHCCDPMMSMSKRLGCKGWSKIERVLLMTLTILLSWILTMTGIQQVRSMWYLDCVAREEGRGTCHRALTKWGQDMCRTLSRNNIGTSVNKICQTRKDVPAEQVDFKLCTTEVKC